MKTISIESWIDMQQVGVEYLTGERCRYSMRLLCDLNESGRELIVEYLGLPHDTVLAKNWNSTVNNRPAVASIMLQRESLRQIADFALFRMGALAIVKTYDGSRGIFDEDMLAKYRQLEVDSPGSIVGVLTNTSLGSQAPGVGSFNTHAFTGRTE